MLDRLLSWMTHSNVPEMRKVAKTARESKRGIPGHLGSRPANAYLEGANSFIQPAKKAARAFTTSGASPSRSSSGWEACRSTPSLALRPSLCYPPEIPKSFKKCAPDG